MNDGYKVVNGIIRSPGRFDGCPAWVPHLWDLANEGFADDDDGNTVRFYIKAGDPVRTELPEFDKQWPHDVVVILREADTGFVYSKVKRLRTSP